jgi:2-methylisocitrate lyase-like PEP mutase family enzyme
MSEPISRVEQRVKAGLFRAMHGGPHLLMLPNAWDAISARIVAAAGFAAIATTSGGVAWALGYADGEAAPWGEVVAATARIARTVAVPVTADIEGGYGETPEAVGRSIGDIIGAGAVGVNLEDGLRPGRHAPGSPPIRSIEDAAARIRAAREAAHAAGVPIVINARTDVYIKNIGSEEGRFDEAVARGRAYLAAGADCVYPIALRDPETIGSLVKALAAPVNIMVRSGLPSIPELEALGVARASTATALPLAAMGVVRQMIEQMRATHRFDGLHPAMTHAEAQQLLAAR